MEINFDNVSLSINNKEILKDISIKINPKQITGIIGTSEAGKTKLLELINASVVPTQGKVTIDQIISEKNVDINNLAKLKKIVGFVYQNPKDRFLCETVKQEIRLHLDSTNENKNNDENRIKNTLKMVGLSEDYLSREIKTLSFTEEKKLAFALAISCNPKILLLDDPSYGISNLDKNELIKLLTMMKIRYNKTIIIVSNDTDFLLKLVDYIYVLDNGKILKQGSKYEILSNEEIMNKTKLNMPKIIEFVNLVREKKQIKLNYRNDINDLVKDIYRNIR